MLRLRVDRTAKMKYFLDKIRVSEEKFNCIIFYETLFLISQSAVKL